MHQTINRLQLTCGIVSNETFSLLRDISSSLVFGGALFGIGLGGNFRGGPPLTPWSCSSATSLRSASTVWRSCCCSVVSVLTCSLRAIQTRYSTCAPLSELCTDLQFVLPLLKWSANYPWEEDICRICCSENLCQTSFWLAVKALPAE